MAQIYSIFFISISRKNLTFYPTTYAGDEQRSSLKWQEEIIAPYHSGRYYGNLYQYSIGSVICLGFFEAETEMVAKVCVLMKTINGVYVKANTVNGATFSHIFVPVKDLGSKVKFKMYKEVMLFFSLP